MSRAYEYDQTTLVTVCHGAACEMFQRELQRVLENIHDPNTDPKKKRVITLKVVFEPNKTREECATSVVCESKLVASIPHDGVTFTGRRQRGQQVEYTAHEFAPRQSRMGEAPTPEEN